MQQEISFLPIFSSAKRLVRYNIGSVAVGSLIVSIVESSSRILKPLRRKLMAVDIRTHNWVGKALSISSHYTLLCIEWIIRSVNHNAYIMVIIYLCFLHPFLYWFSHLCFFSLQENENVDHKVKILNDQNEYDHNYVIGTVFLSLKVYTFYI